VLTADGIDTVDIIDGQSPTSSIYQHYPLSTQGFDQDLAR